MNRPTINDAKVVQRVIQKLGYHIVWFDDLGFEMAHTEYPGRQLCYT